MIQKIPIKMTCIFFSLHFSKYPVLLSNVTNANVNILCLLPPSPTRPSTWLRKMARNIADGASANVSLCVFSSPCNLPTHTAGCPQPQPCVRSSPGLPPLRSASQRLNPWLVAIHRKKPRHVFETKITPFA